LSLNIDPSLIFKYMWEVFKIVWPLFAFVIGLDLMSRLVKGWAVKRSRAGKRKDNSPPATKALGKKFSDYDFPWHDPKACLRSIDQMSGLEFEKFLIHLYQRLGYRTVLTPERKDHGADIIITDLQGRKFAVQAKKLQDNRTRVGAGVLGELFRGMQWYKCAGGIVVTNQYFTNQAIEEAKRYKINLWDRPALIERIKRAGRGFSGTARQF